MPFLDVDKSAERSRRSAGSGFFRFDPDARCLPDRRLLGLVRLWRHGTAPLGRPDQHQRQHPGPDGRGADHRATALSLWDDVADVTFTFTTGAADIRFINDGSGDAVTSYNVSGTSLSNATVHISSNWSGGAATGNFSYFFQTYVHEIGHALGLGHQGPYNGSSTYGVDNIYTNDTWRWSTMSYHDQDDAAFGDTFDYVLTPQMADIYAVQSIYGAQSTRTGNTTYGFNSNAGSFYNFATYSGTPAFTYLRYGRHRYAGRLGIFQQPDHQPGAGQLVLDRR